MKKLRYCIVGVFISCAFFMISCQEEERELIDPTLDNTIPKDSQLARLMRNIVTHDGSYDDLVDGGNCYSINLPYSIIRNMTEEIVIDQIGDYNRLNQSDDIKIQFPITVTRDNHVEEIIENDIELQLLANSCELQDDDIECVDFVYPFRFATFNSNNNVINTLEVLHDAQVFGFMENLDENTLVAINYPIRLLLSNGEYLDATHNDELLSRILAFETSCEENDG
ncbi:hypothetical protein D1818_20080 [Aquimarina sp. BL5]|uniref:hypothetical protein n=1 Tax=Aquimarina sp. BL5 TaxID=1714860 RepID=UPI000E4970FA|nr:hypothetical protein [Aquimarina sp. BL5]AXT53010.1 hypothetical protein D1818_20080 [Aquimarina sp. BL5]RKN07337.1 hypothetical protein D7036_07720 [Aquimarina sp. BL5]